jgi:hypothetical protein
MASPDASPFVSASGAALYLYAITTAPPPSVDRAGLDDRPVHVFAHEDFGLVVGAVDPTAWTGEAGADHLKDLSWVGPRAYRHEQVVEAVMAAAPAVFPARFGTLFSSPDRLRATLDTRAEALRDYLRTVEGAAEWAVKGLLDRDRAAERQVDAPADASGTAYLQRQKQKQDAAAALDDWLDTVADGLFDPLAARARKARVLPVPADAGREAEVAFNWAFLVPSAAAEAFGDAVEAQSARYADEGVSLDLTGPWPPYHFRPSLTLD